MAMRGPLRRELRKYRKGRAGTMPNVPGRRHYVTGAVPGPVHGTYPADLYMWGVPGSYHPNMNAPAAQSDEYITDADWESHQVQHSHQERLFPPFPEHEPIESTPDYDQTRAFSEFFLKAMEVQYQPVVEGQKVPTLADIWHEHMMEEAEQDAVMQDGFDGLMGLETSPEQTQKDLPELWDIADALGHLQNVFPENHPDIVHLRAAAHEILEHPERLPQVEDFGVEFAESRLGSGNPYEMDLVDEPEMPEMAYPEEGLFEQQIQTAGDVLESPVFGFDQEPDLAPDGYADLEAMLGTPEAGLAEPGGLEQMIQQEGPFDAPLAEIIEQDIMPDAVGPDMGIPGFMPEADRLGLMTPEDEVNEAMNVVAGQPEMDQEPNPFQAQYDPFTTAQQMFDEQMQYMDNPFMMPGMGPMQGPAPGM